jgi:tetratricopeptide (TPR) repeat protein
MKARLSTSLCILLTVTHAAQAAPGAPVSVAELTDIREIGALDQKTLDEAESVFFDGLGHYRAGRFEAAAQAFQKAHTLTRHRDMLFNVARSRERMGDIPGAVEWYRAYLATQPADETAVIHKVRQLGAEPVAQAPTVVADEAPVEVETIERGPGPWPWIAAGVGVAALAGGAVMGFQALSEAQAARDAEIRRDAQKHKDTAESRALVADVCFGAAAAAAGTAVFLWWRADADSAGAGRIDVGVVPGGGAIGYTSRF